MSRHDYEQLAVLAPEYVADDRSPELITVLANKYCEALDAGDNYHKDVYFSALMLKYWDNIDHMQNKCERNAHANYGDYTDYEMKLASCIQIACDKKYRKWQVAGSKTTAKACIYQVIETRGTQEIIYEANLNKNKVHAAYNTVSLDQTMTAEDDESGSLAEITSDLNEDPSVLSARLAAESIVQKLISKNLITEAIYADVIAFDNSVKEVKVVKTSTLWELQKNEDGDQIQVETPYTYTARSYIPSDHEIIKCLRSLPKDYVSYFSRKYEVKADLVAPCIDRINKVNNSKLYVYLKKMRESAKRLISR